MPRARKIEGVCVPLPDLYINIYIFNLLACIILSFSKVCVFLPRCTHQKNKFSRQMNIFSAIMVFNVLPCLIKDQFCVFDLSRSKYIYSKVCICRKKER